ncbi:flavin monoamine oxidase family protein [Pseudomonas aeruginosa]|uniref:flavin monoamine oxidase family protein n=1 Tax=Pseudomonas aeruginosa TaxID=287 RepID=UPI002480F1B8|nr:flavin monoamine oxidase family protein [Pseudomonas aeruginosa]WGT14390.1 flavin monoamine oxidase family protein [Pseudomonas aeruginosa]
MSLRWLRAAAFLMLGVFSAVALGKDKQPTAIVVCAGLAGLSAAYELQKDGWQVTVLEARPQVGGRSGLATSEWVGNQKVQPTLNAYLDTFKLKPVPAPDFVRTPSYLIDGLYYSSSDLALKQPNVAADLKRFESTLDDLSASISDPLNPASSNTLFALDQMNAARWLDKLNLSPTARLLVNQRIRSRYDEPSRLSLLYLAQQGRAYRGVDDRDLRAARLPGGSQVLAEAFVKQIKTIKTKSKVSSIVQAKDGVAVKAGSETYKADYVVLAVPLKALGQIQMTPSLSGTQMSALKGTNYGWRDQILLKFKRPVWDDKSRLSGEIFSDQGLGMIWVEPALKGGANVLINLSGDNARVLQAFGDRQMVDQVLIRMNKFYPKMRGAFAGYEIRRYSADPGTGGSYLAYGPGQVTRFWRIWEQPLSRVAFAGEHTDALYPGTIEGALRSGKRAASQVRDLYAGKTPVIEGAPMVAKAEKVAAPTTGGEKKNPFAWFTRLFD